MSTYVIQVRDNDQREVKADSLLVTVEGGVPTLRLLSEHDTRGTSDLVAIFRQWEFVTKVVPENGSSV